jgi:hypothetical protein
VTADTDPADFGGSTFTFSRNQKASDAIANAAKAIAFATHKQGQSLQGIADAIEVRMYDELTRNIGVEA